MRRRFGFIRDPRIRTGTVHDRRRVRYSMFCSTVLGCASRSHTVSTDTLISRVRMSVSSRVCRRHGVYGVRGRQVERGHIESAEAAIATGKPGLGPSGRSAETSKFRSRCTPWQFVSCMKRDANNRDTAVRLNQSVT